MKCALILLASLVFASAVLINCGGKGEGEKERNCRALHKRLEVCNRELDDDQRIMKRQVADRDRFMDSCIKNYAKVRTVKMIECLTKPGCPDFLTCIEHRPGGFRGPEPEEPIGRDAPPVSPADMPSSPADMPSPPADMPLVDRPN